MTSSSAQRFKSIPKVELHRHLEGSLRLDTLQEIARQYQIVLPGNGNLQKLVQVHPGEPQNMVNFLSKFQVLRQFYQTPEIIRRVAYEAIADAALDGIRYIELMFTPVALSRMHNYPLDEVIEWVIESTQRASRDFGIQSRLIVSVNRHESPDLAAQVVPLAIKYMKQGIVALNLAGNEADFSAAPFIPVFQDAYDHGLGITIHAGEWSGADNIQEAILKMHAARIGHGVRVLEDPQVVALVREKQIPFEICLTSNLQTGVINTIDQHPLLKMIRSGLIVTLNTDDPGISGITLSHEFTLAHHRLDIPLTTLADCTLTAARSSFLSSPEKEALLIDLQQQLEHYLS